MQKQKQAEARPAEPESRLEFKLPQAERLEEALEPVVRKKKYICYCMDPTCRTGGFVECDDGFELTHDQELRKDRR